MPTQKSALIVIDAQNDFCPGGALAVADGDAILEPVNALIAAADTVILTQDWHPAHHKSFASQHADRSPFELVDMAYGPQVLWPDHCVQGTDGAAFHKALNTDKVSLILRKGMNPDVDSYSAFFENDQTTSTGLAGWLAARGIETVQMAGLATDYCVAWSALDAVKLGFETSVVMSACRAIDLDGSLQAQSEKMRDAGIQLIDTL